MNSFLKIKSKKIGVHLKNNLKLINNFIKNKFYYNINALSFFIGNPLKWNKKISIKYLNIINFIINKFDIDYKFIIPHSSYLINLGSPIKKKLYNSINLFKKEINICLKLKFNLINFHLGNHLNIISENKCIDNIINSINYILDTTNDIILVIENSSGQGTSIGYKLDHISDIIKSINYKFRIGVCIDTSHVFSSGYKLNTFLDCENFFLEFDKKIGFKYIKALHLNGSKSNFCSKIDRHSELLNSKLGNVVFYWVMRNNLFNNIPIILETTNFKLWLNEINWLYSI